MQDHTVQAGAKTYVARLGHNGIAMLEEQLCKLHSDGVLPKEKDAAGNAIPINVMYVTRLPRFTGTRLGLWGALESARRKYRTRPDPFTPEEAGDILDEGNFDEIETAVMRCLHDVLPQHFSDPDEAKRKASEGSEPKNDQEETVPTGTRSSKSRSKQDSQ